MDAPDQLRKHPFNRWTLLLWILMFVLIGGVAYVVPELWKRYQRERKIADSQQLNKLLNSSGVIVQGKRVEKPIWDGQIILIRKGNDFAAFIPLEQNINPESLTYRWYARNDGKGTFAADDPLISSGVETVGSQNFGASIVRFESFQFEWSSNGEGWGWIYYDRFETDQTSPGDLRFCLTDFENLDQIDARDPQFVYAASASDAGISGDQDISSSELKDDESNRPRTETRID